ncbi:hypothetical protein [Shouchella shacheensis]|uniref:hypothetical protein n=1 Tax=Shouchella shacheensis TaxID=1649580 RepID=UPI00074033F6|nr:hypothetical protein [Shouchella shacheensis]
MRKRIITITSMLLIMLATIGTTEAVALTFEALPTAQESQQWKVTIDESERDPRLTESEREEFDTYALDIRNIGEEVHAVEVRLFRNEPGSTTKYSLLPCPGEENCHRDQHSEALALAEQLNDDLPYQFDNFPLAVKATELEVEIVWEAIENEDRPLKETFLFDAEAKTLK